MQPGTTPANPLTPAPGTAGQTNPASPRNDNVNPNNNPGNQNINVPQSPLNTPTNPGNANAAPATTPNPGNTTPGTGTTTTPGTGTTTPGTVVLPGTQAPGLAPNNAGTNPGAGGALDRSINQSGQARINQGQLLSGLITESASVNVGSLSPNNLVDMGRTQVLDRNQSQTLMQAISNNPRARQASERLTQQLRNANLIPQGQSVVGVVNGTVYTAPSTQR